ncbi:MAG: hypothetical protein CMI13_16445 [Oleibacter sp.]|nr:hypothetical protein [Thalassolituus sp.]|tara:strand:+ start:689 stop:1993 length:1305 start_codon:yes stop_codon:yes gene_type:complete
MKNLHLSHLIFCCFSGLALTACGGGDGGDSSVNDNPPIVDDENEPVDEVVFEPVIFSNFQRADFVLTTDDEGADLFSDIYANPFVSEDGSLWIGDYSANQLVRFTTLPESDGVAATYIDSIQYRDGENAVQDYQLLGPSSPVVSAGRMIVPLYSDNSVVIFDSIPVTGAENTGIILGTGSFEEEPAADCSALGISGPEGLAAAGGKLVVTDSGHNRVLIWNTMPTQSGTLPDIVLGQNSLDHCIANDDNQDGDTDSQPSARTFDVPAGAWTDGEKLLVIDSTNNRVLVWNTFPTENFEPADLVLGQPDFASNNANDADQDSSEDDPSAQTMNYPFDGIYSNGEQIFVTDGDNNRVLIWNSWPTENGQAADVVLGQGSFTNTAANDDNQDDVEDVVGEEYLSTDRTMAYPSGLLLHEKTLIVIDNYNRLMFFSGE